MNLGLGVDTGGTYTDSVIIDFDSGEVITKAKALTTRHDLSIGIADSIDNLDRFEPGQIRLVSVSTTLATNSIVEGKGAPACLLGIGYDEKTLYKYGLRDSFPIKEVRLIAGGHEISGQEIRPLDVQNLKKAIVETRDLVDAYGISAYGGVRNPEHEIKARRMVEDLCDLPVVCGHELTSRLNSIKRAITVAFNARLVPVIRELLTAIKDVLHDRHINAPMMVVKGDGHIVSDRLAIERPIETILSGPAASIMGVSYLSGVKSGIVADMGGTTTDIAILRNGAPKINDDGAAVGGWRTSIRAADIHTAGLGGDSHITIDRDEKIAINPQRVIPLSLAAYQHPEIVDELKRLVHIKWTTNMLPPTDFLINGRKVDHKALNENERNIHSALQNGPKSTSALSAELKLLHPAFLDTNRLEEHGIVSRIGLTPTDVLHAEGSYSVWNSEAARLSMDIYARHLDMEPIDLIGLVKAKVTKKLSTEILSKFISEELTDPTAFDCKVCWLFLEKMLGNKMLPELDLSLSVKPPIIAIGAPVNTYFPPVASQLSAQLIIPDHAEVANAVGAITGNIIETVEILIDPIYSLTGIECYTVHSPIEKIDFDSLDEAISYAQREAERLAKERAIQAGASQQIEVKVYQNDQTATAAKGYDQSDLLLASRIKATAIGKPDLFSMLSTRDI
jgi:N-methylhydantoinase A/oxoprolinase/acetone carboxylase beta subunit